MDYGDGHRSVIDDEMSISPYGRNVIFTPIFKPYAECDLVVDDTDSDGPFTTKYLNFFLKEIERNYDDRDDEEFVGDRKKFFIDVHTANYEQAKKKIRKFT